MGRRKVRAMARMLAAIRKARVMRGAEGEAAVVDEVASGLASFLADECEKFDRERFLTGIKAA